MRRLAIAALLLLPAARAQLLQPFSLDHRAASSSPADLSFLLDAPAGKDGFIQIRNGHLAKGNGERIRFWGVHFTDWSPGSVEIVPKEDAAFWASTLARFGINLVRLHFLDLNSPRGLIDASSPDSSAFDPAQLDRLDYEVAQLKQHGIYVDLNLNVGRSYKAGDGVRDFDKIRWAKGLTLFDPRLIELEKDYARRLLTHVNSYTHTAYRDEPAVALVEIVNENGLYLGFRAPTPYYGQELTALYNAPLPRLKPDEIASASPERFRTEMLFYMDAENRFYQDMSAYLQHTLGVRCPIIGTADHAHSSSPYPMLSSLAKLDVLDGHTYWEHPGAPPPHNTPMVDDPLHSTVVQLSRTAFSGKPYTVSEFNHPFPNDYLAEGIPILAAYASFQDWDAVVAYTFEPKRDPTWKPYIGDPFDISLDPVRMTQMAAGALLFLRSDVHPARQTIERTYSPQQVIDSRRLPRAEQPYYTPGFPLALPLEHAVRIRSLDGPPTGAFPPAPSNPIVSDTGELTWSASSPHTGLVTIETPRTEAIIGFLPAHPLTHLAAEVKNNFAAIVLSSLDGQPLAQSSRLLLTAAARAANTDMKWNADHTRLASQGGPPTLIEPVTGSLTLRGLTAAREVFVSPLDGAGRPIRQTTAYRTGIGWNFPVGDPATTWYVISVRRK